MIVTITNIRKAERDTKRGKSMSLSIQTEQFGNKWIGGWENEINKSWAVGQRVGIETITNGDYLNYNLSEEQPPKEEKQIATTEKTKNDSIALLNGDWDTLRMPDESGEASTTCVAEAPGIADSVMAYLARSGIA